MATGAEVSIVHPSRTDRLHGKSSTTFQAFSSSSISTFGLCSVAIDIGLRRLFRWAFIIADIPHAILEADFLRHLGLDISLPRKKLVDTVTNLAVLGSLSQQTSTGIRTIIPPSRYANVLADFPAITKPCNLEAPRKHSVTHYLVTTGPPVVARPRRLFGERLQTAGREFDHMVQLGRANGLLLSIWFRRGILGTGALVGTIEPSTPAQSWTSTHYHTSMTAPLAWRVHLYSARLIF